MSVGGVGVEGFIVAFLLAETVNLLTNCYP